MPAAQRQTGQLEAQPLEGEKGLPEAEEAWREALKDASRILWAPCVAGGLGDEFRGESALGGGMAPRTRSATGSTKPKGSLRIQEGRVVKPQFPRMGLEIQLVRAHSDPRSVPSISLTGLS